VEIQSPLWAITKYIHSRQVAPSQSQQTVEFPFNTLSLQVVVAAVLTLELVVVLGGIVIQQSVKILVVVQVPKQPYLVPLEHTL